MGPGPTSTDSILKRQYRFLFSLQDHSGITTNFIIAAVPIWVLHNTGMIHKPRSSQVVRVQSPHAAHLTSTSLTHIRCKRNLRSGIYLVIIIATFIWNKLDNNKHDIQTPSLFKYRTKIMFIVQQNGLELK